MAYPQLGLPSIDSVNYILDADFIIPAAQGFPDLPAGKAQDRTIKLAMDCEGIVFNCDGTFFISDEYGRTDLLLLHANISVCLPFQQGRDTDRSVCPPRSILSPCATAPNRSPQIPLLVTIPPTSSSPQIPKQVVKITKASKE